mmetsp:Transcript_9661/g.16872  ORF Transcript_9661/g.16872 Transcript_9661/m.16872 type:complete len:101 (+) Transcript_9661:591-893(+)
MALLNSMYSMASGGQTLCWRCLASSFCRKFLAAPSLLGGRFGLFGRFGRLGRPGRLGRLGLFGLSGVNGGLPETSGRFPPPPGLVGLPGGAADRFLRQSA